MNTFVIQKNRFAEKELDKLTTAISNAGKTFRWLTNQSFDLYKDRSSEGNLIDRHGTFVFLSVDKFLEFYNNCDYRSSYINFFDYSFFNRLKMNDFLDQHNILTVNGDGEVYMMEELSSFVLRELDSVVFTNTPTRTPFTGGRKLTESVLNEIMLAGELQESPYFVADPKNIVDEVRFVIVNSEVVTSSYYRYNGKFVTQNREVLNYNVSPIAMATAKKIVKLIHEKLEFSSVCSYVLDLARLDNENSWRFLEVNALPCSGFYGCNYDKIIESLIK